MSVYDQLLLTHPIIVCQQTEGMFNFNKVPHQRLISKLQLNISKTKIVIFSRVLARKPPTWIFGTESLEVVSEYVYLGITFNFNGRFTKAINKQILQAKRTSYSIIAKGRKFELPIDIQLHLFDTCI